MKNRVFGSSGDRVKLFVVGALIFAALSAGAQDIPDAPSAVAVSQQRLVSSQQLVARDRAEKRAFIIVTAIDFFAMFADAAVSSHAHFRQGGVCHELNPMYGGPYPSTQRFFLQMPAQTAGIAVLSWFLMRKHQDWFVLAPLIDATLHTVGASGTAGLCL